MSVTREILTDKDIRLEALAGKKVAILGYGNQGRPHALNLRDSGITVAVGARQSGAAFLKAQIDGFEILSLEKATAWADVVMMMFPDEQMASLYKHHVGPHLAAGKYLGFCHGLAIHTGWLQPGPEVNVFLVAPKAQGRGVRNKYTAGSGVPALYAVHQDVSGNTKEVALAYAKALGCGRAGIFPTSFKEETECDLFSEQAVLCGGLTMLIKTAFETLVEAGFSEEAAYFECMYEVKLLADLLHERGITGTRKAISSTALYGDLSRGEKIIDAHVRENMRRVLSEILSGKFYAEMKSEFEAGKPFIRERLEADYHHPIEQTHRALVKYLH